MGTAGPPLVGSLRDQKWRDSGALRFLLLFLSWAVVDSGPPLWSGFRNGGQRLGLGTASGMTSVPAQKVMLGPAAAASASVAPPTSGRSYSSAMTFTSSPAIAEDGRIFGAFGDGTVRAFFPSGSVNWTYTGASSFYSSPQLDSSSSRSFVCASDGTVVALSASTGALLWSLTVTGPCGSSPALSKDETRLYVTTSPTKTRTGSTTGFCYPAQLQRRCHVLTLRARRSALSPQRLVARFQPYSTLPP